MQRKTIQREAIRKAFAGAGRPLSPQEALELAQDAAPGLGIATVYRAVKELTGSGWLRAVELPGEPARYERTNLPHHHHFHCRQCNRVFDIQGCALAVERIAPAGAQIDDHEVILYGRCADCVTDHPA